jgi:DNA-binding transcriptional LysR family regulator
LSNLAGEEMILGKPGDILREIMDGYFQQVGITPRITSEVDEPGAVEEFVAAGLGVSFIPELPTTPQPLGLTSRIAITNPTCELTLGLAWNTDRYLSLAARAFRGHVVAYFATASPNKGFGMSPRIRPIDELTASRIEHRRAGELQ